MTRYVRDPDGAVHAFDDEATPEQIDQEMTNRWNAKKTAPQPAQIPGSKPGGMQPLEGAPDMTMVPLGEEAERAKRMALIGGLMGNRALATAGTNLYEHDPTYQARSEAAKGAGKASIDLANRRAAGTRVMPGIDALRQMVAGASEDDWQQAAGPYNTTPQPAANTVPISREAWRAPDMTPTQARANYGPSAGDPDYLRQWNLQNDLEHLVGALTEQYITAMGKGAIANSDAKMGLFKDLMNRLRYSPDRKGAMRILDTADNASRNTFSLDPALSEGQSGSKTHPIAVKGLDDAKLYRSGTHVMTPDGRVMVAP